MSSDDVLVRGQGFYKLSVDGENIHIQLLLALTQAQLNAKGLPSAPIASSSVKFEPHLSRSPTELKRKIKAIVEFRYRFISVVSN